jgi:aminopeptidase-like protein
MSAKNGGLDFETENIGDVMLSWAQDLFPMRRSLSGPGVRETLDYFKCIIPEIQSYEISSGTTVFDWTVPNEWTLRDAYVTDPNGKKIIDINDHGLHIVGYSEPVDKYCTLDELREHLHTLPEQPDVIPYVTSYYERRWGFCLTQNKLDDLTPGRYHVKVDADLKPGVLNYADLVIPGAVKEEIVISTYICHPMMANNELSGPVVALALARWLSTIDCHYTYRFIFVPETIGALIYLQRYGKHLKQYTKAGLVLTCIGDEGEFSFLPSRTSKTYADRVARFVFDNYTTSYKSYSFLERGSDERQYCSPLVDLPFISVMRSKYGTYPEYHTSADDFSLVTSKGLAGSFKLVQKIISALEINHVYKIMTVGEPQLGKRGLYPSLSSRGSANATKGMMDLLAYADGNVDLLEISHITGACLFELSKIAHELMKYGLITRIQSIDEI